MRRWTEDEYDAIFRDHPPTEPTAPRRAECGSLAQRLGRSAEAILAQWNDGRSAVLGNVNASSESLRDYLVRRGWL